VSFTTHLWLFTVIILVHNVDRERVDGDVLGGAEPSSRP